MKSLTNGVDKRELLARLAKFHPAAQRRWGRMTPHEAICHLSDSYQAGLGERHASPASGLFQRTFMKWAALYAPSHWPHGIRTRPEMEAGVGGTPPVEFTRDLDSLTRLVERFASRPPDFSWAPHPIFGPLTADQWLRWGWLHADHHLRQFGL
jgi:hypothetical protein